MARRFPPSKHPGITPLPRKNRGLTGDSARPIFWLFPAKFAHSAAQQRKCEAPNEHKEPQQDNYHHRRPKAANQSAMLETIAPAFLVVLRRSPVAPPERHLHPSPPNQSVPHRRHLPPDRPPPPPAGRTRAREKTSLEEKLLSRRARSPARGEAARSRRSLDRRGTMGGPAAGRNLISSVSLSAARVRKRKRGAAGRAGVRAQRRRKIRRHAKIISAAALERKTGGAGLQPAIRRC